MRCLFCLAMLLISSPALACQFHTDCDAGSRCEKDRGQLYGVCKSGLNPGNSFDRKPVYDPLDDSRGDTCSFNTDCSPGSRCEKEPGSLYGTCVSGRWQREDSSPKRTYQPRTYEPRSYEPRTYEQPTYQPRRHRQDEEDGTCSWDTQCPFGHRCEKGSGRLKGVCVPRR